MTEYEALLMMQEEIQKTDAKTAMLLQFGANALIEKFNNQPKTLTEHRLEVCDKVCDALCDKKKKIKNKYELLEVCENCPLKELR